MAVAAESRRKQLSLSSLCRFCLTSENCTSIYDRTKTQKPIAMPLQIMSCLAVEVFPSDGMPTQICTKCKFFMELFFHFKTLCRSGDETILQHIKDGSPLEPITWPSKLNKIYKTTESRPKKLEVKTIVAEDGATLQVMASNEHIDSDDNEENVYNYKVEDDFHVTKDAACIKVLKTGETLQINKQEIIQKKTKDSVEKPYSCNLCDKSYAKNKQLVRHARTQHHLDNGRGRAAFGAMSDLSCEQCTAKFTNQDDLIYHSAKHATQDLTCPLCKERFQTVEEVSDHIKSHVEGEEFMCDLCELVFTSKNKLDEHIARKHDEIEQEEDSEEQAMETEDDDDNINVKEEQDHMVVEIKKPNSFIKLDSKTDESSEEEIEVYADGTMAEIRSMPTLQMSPPKPALNKTPVPQPQNSQTAALLRKAEEINKKAQQQSAAAKKNNKSDQINPESKGTKGISDKSLRLLEQELQDLKRTNVRNESQKPAAKFAKVTPKQNKRAIPTIPAAKNKPVEEKKPTPVQKTAPIEKKQLPDKAVFKENKEPKDAKDTKVATPTAKQEKDKTAQTSKVSTKNGTSENAADENVRRSSRGSKVKDYAQMIKDRSRISSDDDSDDVGDEDYKGSQAEGRRKRVSVSKPPAKEVATPTTKEDDTPVAKKRGRPRKEVVKSAAVPAKMRKSNEHDDNKTDDKEERTEDNNNDDDNSTNPVPNTPPGTKSPVSAKPPVTTPTKQSPIKDGALRPAAPVVLSPSGQTLKPVSVASLPPGVKPLPLPIRRPVGDQDKTCNMQIGKKLVKVKKIVMTKAEVQEMAKKGLLEVKDGTMVLKPGIKLPQTETKQDFETNKESHVPPRTAETTQRGLDDE